MIGGGAAGPQRPTLLFQGGHDSIVLVGSARSLHHALVIAGVPVVYVEFPRTEHAFNILYPPLAGPSLRQHSTIWSASLPERRRPGGRLQRVAGRTGVYVILGMRFGRRHATIPWRVC